MFLWPKHIVALSGFLAYLGFWKSPPLSTNLDLKQLAMKGRRRAAAPAQAGRPLKWVWIPACRQAGKVPRTCGVWWVKGAKKAKSNFLKKISSAHVARNILFRNRWITNFSNLLLKWTLKLGPLKRQFIELRTEAEHFKNPIVWAPKTFALRRF